MPPKKDAAEIEAFWDSLPEKLGLDSRRSWWPTFLYRFDDVRAVAAILTRGAILSRNECDKAGIPLHHTANRAVIANTPHLHDNARLYFRPLTPTQYHMEGILAKSQIRETGEHCPVPVFLLFHAKKLLAEEGVFFTDSAPTRAGQYNVGSTAEFLQEIRFEYVFHDAPVADEMKRYVIGRRHAEVFTNKRLGLEHLVGVVCRTGPERDTLLHLLGPEAQNWENRIKVAAPGRAMFRRNGIFVTSAKLINDELHFEMPARLHDYEAHLVVSDPATGKLIFERRRTDAKFKSYWTVTLPTTPPRALVTLVIEGALAFQAILSQPKLVGG